MESLEGFDYFPLRADGKGRIEKQAEQDALIAHVKQAAPSDLIFIAHGFRNDESDARRLYSAFLSSFRAHLARPELAGLRSRKFAVCGVLWPAKAFRESFDEGGVQSTGDDDAEKREARRRLEDLKETDASATQRPKMERAIELLDTVDESKAAQDEFVELVLSLLDEAEVDATEGLDQIRTKEGSICSRCSRRTSSCRSPSRKGTRAACSPSTTSSAPAAVKPRVCVPSSGRSSGVSASSSTSPPGT